MIAVLLAGAAAVGYGVSSVLQAVGARRSEGTLRTLGQPLYLTGLGIDLLAWLVSLVALRTLPVYQVQAILAGSLAVTVVTARLVLATRLRRADVIAVAGTAGALAVLAASSGPQHPVQLPGPVRFAMAGAAVLVAVAGWLAASKARPDAAASKARPDAAAVQVRPDAGDGGTGAAAVQGGTGMALPKGRPNVVAVLAGLAFGGTALAARALVLPAQPLRDLPATVLAVAADPLVWALVCFGATGMLLYANALEYGQVGPVTALLWIVEVVVPSAVGVAVLGDTVRQGWAPAAVIAVLVTVTAAAVLAAAPAQAAVTAPDR